MVLLGLGQVTFFPRQIAALAVYPQSYQQIKEFVELIFSLFFFFFFYLSLFSSIASLLIPSFRGLSTTKKKILFPPAHLDRPGLIPPLKVFPQLSRRTRTGYSRSDQHFKLHGSVTKQGLGSLGHRRSGGDNHIKGGMHRFDENHLCNVLTLVCRLSPKSALGPHSHHVLTEFSHILRPSSLW